MIGNLFLYLLIGLGCAILAGLILVVLALTWWVIKIIAQAAKEVQSKRTPKDK